MCVGGPTIYNKNYQHFHLTSILTLECRSKNSIPTNVIWLMNDTVVDISQPFYQTMQIVDAQYSRTGSYFRNILIVNDLLEALGNPTYTCIVENTFGKDSEDIAVHKEGKHSL